MADHTGQSRDEAAPEAEEQATRKGPDEEQAPSWVRTLAWSPDGTMVATGGTDGHVRIIDAHSGEERHRLQSGGPVWVLAWSPDGTLLATASTDGTARIIDVDSGEERHQLHGSTAADSKQSVDIEQGEVQLQDLQDSIDKARSGTGEPRVEEDKEPRGGVEGDSDVAAPG